MKPQPLVKNGGAPIRANRRLLTATGALIVVLLFASQWYAYDSGHGIADPFVDYLGWSCYLWGVLTPVALALSGRFPIDSVNWRRAVPLHLGASLLLAIVQLSLEAFFEWVRARGGWPLMAVLRHYLSQHTEVGFLVYWIVVGAVQFYRMHDQARAHELRAAQLESRLAEARLEALRSQLQPHFLFNTLQAATALVREEPDGAEEILLGLSELLRFSLDEAQSQEISLCREIEFLKHYVRIQQRRFGDRLRFDFQIDADVLSAWVPSLMLQPLVENAVRYGIGKHKESDLVTLRAFQSQDRLCLEISNLTGVLEDSPDRLPARGIGLLNTRARLEQLYGQDHILRLANLPPRGVVTLLSIPLRRSRPNAAGGPQAVPERTPVGAEPRFDTSSFPQYNRGLLSTGR